MRLGEFVGLVQAFARWWNARPVVDPLENEPADVLSWVHLFIAWDGCGRPKPGEPLT